MASNKRLNSVAQSIAHHAVSGLSYVHPHLGKMCDKSGISSVIIDILADDIYPVHFSENKPLRLALNQLKITFIEILHSEGFSINDISEVTLRFKFDFLKWDHYCSICTTKIIALSGRVYEKTVNFEGFTEQKH
jgi:hypothetical protein